MRKAAFVLWLSVLLIVPSVYSQTGNPDVLVTAYCDDTESGEPGILLQNFTYWNPPLEDKCVFVEWYVTDTSPHTPVPPSEPLCEGTWLVYLDLNDETHEKRTVYRYNVDCNCPTHDIGFGDYVWLRVKYCDVLPGESCNPALCEEIWHNYQYCQQQ